MILSNPNLEPANSPLSNIQIINGKIVKFSNRKPNTEFRSPLLDVSSGNVSFKYNSFKWPSKSLIKIFKKPRTPYQLFYKEMVEFKKVIANDKLQLDKLNREISLEWKYLTNDLKLKYFQEYQAELANFDNQVEVYKFSGFFNYLDENLTEKELRNSSKYLKINRVIEDWQLLPQDEKRQYLNKSSNTSTSEFLKLIKRINPEFPKSYAHFVKEAVKDFNNLNIKYTEKDLLKKIAEEWNLLDGEYKYDDYIKPHIPEFRNYYKFLKQVEFERNVYFSRNGSL